MYKFRLNYFNINSQWSSALRFIFGIGWYKSFKILSSVGFSDYALVGKINNFYKDILFYYLENFIMTESNINHFISENIRKLIDINTYKGSRHKMSLPVHGQRTRTNANTRRSIRLLAEKLERLKLINDKRSKRR